MDVEGVIDLAIFVCALCVIGVGVALAISVPWAMVTVGGLTLVTVFAAKLLERPKQQEADDDELA